MRKTWQAPEEIALATVGGAVIEFILADPARLADFGDWLDRLGLDMPLESLRGDLERVLAIVPLRNAP